MVAVTRSLLALLLCQALLGGAAGLMPEVGRRRFSEPGRAASAAQRPEDLLSEFELRLLHMFGLKRRPSPGKDVVIPPYMLDLYRLHAGQQLGQPAALGFPLERAASRANTVRSFHHEGTGGRGLRERRGGGKAGPEEERGADSSRRYRGVRGVHLPAGCAARRALLRSSCCINFLLPTLRPPGRSWFIDFPR